MRLVFLPEEEEDTEKWILCTCVTMELPKETERIKYWIEPAEDSIPYFYIFSLNLSFDWAEGGGKESPEA